MLQPHIGSLAYRFFTRYLPAGNTLLAVTDMLLLALSIGVVFLTVRSLLRPQPAPVSPVSS